MSGARLLGPSRHARLSQLASSRLERLFASAGYETVAKRLGTTAVSLENARFGGLIKASYRDRLEHALLNLDDSREVCES